MGEPINGDELLEKIHPQLPSVEHDICLRPDLLHEWQAEVDAYEQALAASVTGRLSGPETAAVNKHKKRIAALEKQIEAASMTFSYVALPIEKYQALTAEHPPRENDQLDLYAGHNRDAVMDAMVRSCLVSPSFSDAGWAKFLAACPPSEWAELRSRVLEVNGSTVRPPKSRQVSRLRSAPASESE